MSTALIRSLLPAWGALAAMLLASPVAAQGFGPPNALQGFSKNRHEPIRIESQSLEVRDKEKTATFIDNVKLTQGDTTLESRRLVVYYNDTGRDGAKAARSVSTAAAGANQQIRRLEATGGVVVTQREHTAVGDQGIYDMATNSVTLVGNVVVTQGKNVIRGDRLWVDLGTGLSRVEAKSGGQGRVQGVFLPGGSAKPSSDNGASGAPTATGSTPASPSSRSSRPPARGSERDRGQAAPGFPPVRMN